MNFKGQYLIHDEYLDLGGTLEEVPFNLLEYDVRKMIDERTFGRLIGIDREELPDAVKICIFKMVEVKEKYQTLKSQNKVVASEGTDGYSISYKKLEKADLETENKELKDIMKSYLANVKIDNVPVLYLGVK